jgi:hypothetical protein
MIMVYMKQNARLRLLFRAGTLIQVRLGTNPAVPRDGCQVAHPSSSRSLRSAQSRKRVPSCVVSRQQFMKYPG